MFLGLSQPLFRCCAIKPRRSTHVEAAAGSDQRQEIRCSKGTAPAKLGLGRVSRSTGDAGFGGKTAKLSDLFPVDKATNSGEEQGRC